MFQLHDIFSKTADAVFAMDNASIVVYGNEPFARLCNQSPDHIEGRHCYDILGGDTLSGERFCQPLCQIGRALRNQQTVDNFDLAIPQPNGHAVWVNVGALLAPAAWHPADIVFTLRPINLSKVLTRFANIEHERPPQPCALTTRERQILKLLVDGNNTQAIINTLHVSHSTVRNHLRNIYEKLGVHSKAEAISYAFRHGLQ